MPQLPITPNAYDFKSMFGIGTFQVPRYQRAYDWDDDEVTDFGRDVRTIVSSRLKGSASQHFFGAVISFHVNQNQFEIVDGQQRLTTQLLALKILRDRWLALVEDTRKQNKAISKTAQTQAEELETLLFDNGEPRLSLSKRDKSYFADMILGVAEKPKRTAHHSHKRLWAAGQLLEAELFEPLLGTITKYAQRQERLDAIQKALLVDGYVVHLKTHLSSDAYRFFMVLNDRGKALSAGDLLRTHTLAALDGYTAQQEAAESDWDEILRMGPQLVNRFLAAYYTSHTGKRVPRGEMYDRFSEQFLPEKASTAAAAKALREQVATLAKEAERFDTIASGRWPYEKSTIKAWDKDRLSRLVKTLNHKLADPLLLAAARNCTAANFRDLVRMLESFVFRYINIANGSAGRLEGLYFKHAKKTTTTGSLDKNGLRNELRTMISSYAPDAVFSNLLPEQLRFGNAQAKALIRHFLTTLEDFEDWCRKGAKGKPTPKSKTSVYVLADVNIEHVYPQNPPTADPLLEPLKHTLGNLTALDENEGQTAGNKTFSDKKEIYESSVFTISQTLSSAEDWDQAAIAARVEFYKERALKVFVVN